MSMEYNNAFILHNAKLNKSCVHNYKVNCFNGNAVLKSYNDSVLQINEVRAPTLSEVKD